MSRALVVAACVLVCLVLVPLQATQPQAGSPVTLTIVHLNDVYEIRPMAGGTAGGLSRVATIVSSLKRSSTALLTTLGGDYLSPTVLGTAIVDGRPLAGKQMVDVLNAVGVDLATFGNHEFDLTLDQFKARLRETKFRLVSTNVTDEFGKPFDGVATSTILPVQAGGRTIRVGVIGVTVGATKKPWVRYRDPIEAAREEIARLVGQTDAIIALTHLSLGEDADFVAAVPEVDVALGGHEHENWLAFRGPRFTPIIKADANVRSLAIVSMAFGAPGTRPVVSSRLQVVDDTTPADPAVDALTLKWLQIGSDAWRRDGFDPEKVVAATNEPLDGRESTVRNRPGRLTSLIAAAVAREAKPVDVAIFNGGSIRVDDVLPAGPITEYDIIRLLPFGGKVARATLDGALLIRVLETGVNNQGLGGFLHTWGVRFENGSWLVGGKPVDPAGRYSVGLTDFLLSGGEVNMAFFTRANPGVRDVQLLRDIRLAVIDELVASFPAK
jgi:5'-nucleotidase